MMSDVGVAVVSRPAESRAISEFLASAAVQPSGQIIAGEAGIGKTTLWLDGLAQARERGFRVLTARVGQAESVMAYTAVADLLRDIETAVLDALPDLQRLALDRVLFRATPAAKHENNDRKRNKLHRLCHSRFTAILPRKVPKRLGTARTSPLASPFAQYYQAFQ